jgi:hypothetical protein
MFMTFKPASTGVLCRLFALLAFSMLVLCHPQHSMAQALTVPAGTSTDKVSEATTSSKTQTEGQVAPPKQLATAAPKLDIQALSLAAGQQEANAPGLVGAGDLIVTLSAESAAKERAYSAENKSPPRLFINGLSLGDDARLISTLAEDKGTSYHFHVKPGKTSADLWASVYRTHGLTNSAKVAVGMGWVTDQSLKPVEMEMAITSACAELIAFLGLASLIGLLLYIALRTDALRDVPTPDHIIKALKVRQGYERLDEQQTTSFLLSHFPSYDVTKKGTYDQALALYQSGATTDPMATTDLQLGIVLASALPREVRGTFSLARVQLALWFTFALGVAVFLYLVKGELLPIEGSVLSLLGIAVGTASAGQLTSPDAVAPFRRSAGLIQDLSTDANDKAQVHRFQAIAVNLLLLVVGADHVIGQLTYPVFDSAWLYFLGISGAAYAAGKQLSEKT